MDFAGPFQGTMFFVLVHAFSKWPQVVTMQSTTVPKTIEALRQMFSTYSLAEHLISNNGPQFTSKEFAIFLKSHRIQNFRDGPNWIPATVVVRLRPLSYLL